MGLVNTVVPLEQLEEETVRLVPRDAEALAVRAADAEGELQRGRGRPRGPAAAGARRQPALLHDRGGRRRAATPTVRSARPTSRSSPAGPEIAMSLASARPVRVASRCASGRWPRGRARCRRRSPRCWSGTALAGSEGDFRPLAFCAALVGSVFIQIGTNLSNDYSDARRGADTEERLGPGAGHRRRARAAAQGAGRDLARVRRSRSRAGAYLIALVGWELLAIGAASILAGVLYTGGPRPYGYEGLGELFVFGFFGIVAVVGSYYVQTEELTRAGVRAGRPGRPAGRRDPDGQQHPRHRHRPARGQAHAGRAARPRPGPAAVRATVTLPFAIVGGRWLRSRRGRELLLAAARGAARAAARAHGRHAHRRALAERARWRARGAAGAVLGAALRGPAAFMTWAGARIEALEVVPYALPFREPYVTARGRLERRELAARAAPCRRGSRGSARRRRSRCAAGRPWR